MPLFCSKDARLLLFLMLPRSVPWRHAGSRRAIIGVGVLLSFYQRKRCEISFLVFSHLAIAIRILRYDAPIEY